MIAMARKVRSILKRDPMAVRSILQEFLLESRKLQTMSEDVVWKMLYFGKQPFFHIASALTLGPTKKSGSEREEEKSKLRTVWAGKL